MKPTRPSIRRSRNKSSRKSMTSSHRTRNGDQHEGLNLERLEPRIVLTASSSSLFPLTLLDQSTYVATYDTLAEQEAFVRAKLASASGTSYLQQGQSDLRLIEVKYGTGGIYNRFIQTMNGIDVFNSFVTVNQRADGSIQQVFDEGHANLKLVDSAVSRILPLQAERVAMSNIGANATFAPSRGKAVWYVGDNGVAKRAWQVTVFPSNPVGDYLTVVDATSLNVILQENRISHATGSGDTFVPNPWQTQGNGAGLSDNNDANSPALTAQHINVTLLGLDDGTGLIKGEFADLSTLNSPNLPDVDADEVTRIYNYNRDDPRFEQVLVYYSVDSMNRYFHALGFDDDSGVPNGIRDFPTLANAHWYTADNSFYSTGNDAIHFGDGGVDDAEDADIVAHEYGHAVQHNQNASWGGGEMGAMGEGFGDYLAASFYASSGDPAYQALHAPCVGEWDATSYSATDPPCLRRVDGNKMYPFDIVGQVHADGEIWSAALWDIRTAVGGAFADQLILEHHFGLPGGATMPIAAEWMLQVNQTLNGGAMEAEIRQAFVDRGILQPLPTAGTVAFDQDLYNTSTTITIEVVDSNAVAPVNVTLTSDTGDTEQLTLVDQGSGSWVGTINTTTGVPAVDGQLQVTLGDTITVQYDDIDDGTGNPLTATDTALIANVSKYSANDVPIVIEAGPHLSTITVPDSGRIADVNIEFNINHTFDADLDVFLIAPDGTRIELFTDVGGSGDNFIDTILDDEAATSITAGVAPFTGSFRPEGSLSTLDGMSITGDWTLEITDDFPFDVDSGTLNSWTICFELAEPQFEGTVAFDAEQYNMIDVVTISVIDANAVAPVTVTVTSDTGDTETVTLTDVGNDEFVATINTTTGSPGADGLLQVALGDVITVEYVDPDDGTGNSNTVLDTAVIVNVKKYDATGLPIVVEAGPHLSIINVTDSGNVGDVNVILDITHTFTADLDVFLISPSGTRIELFTDVGGGGDNFTNTTLDSQAATSIVDGSAPFTGVFRPEGSLDALNGQSITGDWVLEITDDFPFDVDSGTLNAWTLCLEIVPPPVLSDVTLAGPSSVGEESGMASYVISIPQPLLEDSASVSYMTIPGSGMEGVDYTPVSGTVTFFLFQTSFTINVPILSDQLAEVDETFSFVLHNPVGLEIINGSVVTSILDDEVYSPELIVDFGTQSSPVNAGDIGIDSLEYLASKGFGWQPAASNLRMADRATGDDFQRDIALLENGSFVVDAVAGTNVVNVWLGDMTTAHDQMEVSHNGQTLGVFSTNAGEITMHSFRVFHSGGQLQLDFADLGGADSDVSIAGLQVSALDEIHFDFVPLEDFVVADGYVAADPTVYTQTRGFGWAHPDTKYIDSFGADALLRDAAAIFDNEFIVDMANGDYDVTLYTGNDDLGQFGIFLSLQDQEVEQVTSLPGEFFVNTYQTTVVDGKLRLRVKENGGFSPFGLIAGMDIVPTTPFARFAKGAESTSSPQTSPAIRDLAFQLGSGADSQKLAGTGWETPSEQAAITIARSNKAAGDIFGPVSTFENRRLELEFSNNRPAAMASTNVSVLDGAISEVLDEFEFETF